MPKLSFDQIRELLSRRLNDGVDPYSDGGFWIADVFVDSVVYCGWSDSKLYCRSYVIDDALSITLGDATEVLRTTDYEPVAATVDFSRFSAGDATAVWRGLIFEAGDYPDKGQKFTPDDLREIARKFRAVPVRVPLMVEHQETIFDEALQDVQMETVEVSEDGTKLFGLIRVPSWLDEGLKNVAKRVSVGLSADKRLLEVSLVRFPRVESAELVAAFSTFAGKRHSTADLKDIQTIHDLAVSQGAACPGVDMSAAPSPQEKTKMTLREKFKALFGKTDEAARAEIGITEQDIDAVFAAAPATATTPAVDPAIQARIEALESQNTALAFDAANKTAAAFADAAIRAQKFFPSERTELTTLFAEALKADGGGTVTFSDTGTLAEGASCKALRSMVEKRPAHGLTEEVIAGRNLSEPSEFSANPVGDPNKQAALMAATPLGAKALANKNGGK